MPIVTVFTIFASAGFGAFLFRFRGGLWGRRLGTDTTEARLIFALGLGAAGWAIARDGALVLLFPAWFFSCLPGWFGAISMGRNGAPFAADAAWMSLRGLIWVTLPAILLWWLGFVAWPLIVAGALCPLAYEVGWRTPLNLAGLTQGTEVGEVIFGALLGSGQAMALMHIG